MSSDVVLNANDLALCRQVDGKMLIVMHRCGDAVEYVHTKKYCAECPFWDVCLGRLKGAK